MERELPGASTPTSAAMPAHDQMLSQFRLTSQYMFASAAAACSCTATGPPVAKSPTSAATPACAWTQSQILAVAEGCRSNSSALLRSSNSLTLFLLSATLGQVHYVAQRGHPGLASCSAQRCPNTPRRCPGHGPERCSAEPEKQPTALFAACWSTPYCWARAGRPAPQGRHFLQAPRGRGVRAQALAASGAQARCCSRSSKQTLERAGAALPASRAGAPALERGAGLVAACWLRCCAETCTQDTASALTLTDRGKSGTQASRCLQRRSAAINNAAAAAPARRIKVPAYQQASCCALAGLQRLSDKGSRREEQVAVTFRMRLGNSQMHLC